MGPPRESRESSESEGSGDEVNRGEDNEKKKAKAAVTTEAEGSEIV